MERGHLRRRSSISSVPSAPSSPSRRRFYSTRAGSLPSLLEPIQEVPISPVSRASQTIFALIGFTLLFTVACMTLLSETPVGFDVKSKLTQDIKNLAWLDTLRPINSPQAGRFALNVAPLSLPKSAIGLSTIQPYLRPTRPGFGAMSMEKNRSRNRFLVAMFACDEQG